MEELEDDAKPRQKAELRFCLKALALPLNARS